MRKVFVVILNWNGKQDTIECLESVKKLGLGNWEMGIIVVDNASTDGSVEELEKRYKEIKILRNEKNLGYAEGNNVGIRWALKEGAEYILLLNNDTLVDKNLVSELLRAMEKGKKIGIVGPKIYFAPGFEYHHDRYQIGEKGRVIWYAGGKVDWQNVYASHRGVDEVDHGQFDEEDETDFVSGCAMMVKREVFGRIGLFNPKYFLYFEDNDLCQRAKKEGYKIFYVPKALLWHKNASSSEKPGSKIHEYYQTRNRFLFGLSYAPWRSKIALFRESLKFLIEDGIRRKATIDFCLGRFGGRSNL